MTVKRMDHVLIVVDDLEAAKAFFLDVGVDAENDTHHPVPGQILLHPQGISETEILIPYGETAFASKAGPLYGNHVMTIVDGRERLAELGRRVLWQGAQPVEFRL